jgi:hypothetical protein
MIGLLDRHDRRQEVRGNHRRLMDTTCESECGQRYREYRIDIRGIQLIHHRDQKRKYNRQVELMAPAVVRINGVLIAAVKETVGH